MGIHRSDAIFVERYRALHKGYSASKVREIEKTGQLPSVMAGFAH
ncbi:hypothetical protein SAMN04488036_101573 [Shimia haliotis]|uniref:Uncharacterized protein n=1 Tax=Shimia haliotis TaxID=1280847 RepID=A0A1I4AUQ1_9RHOB|nr:hypothetical protein SAMN04488036_101573 [Shimia haliotis]